LFETKNTEPNIIAEINCFFIFFFFIVLKDKTLSFVLKKNANILFV